MYTRKSGILSSKALKTVSVQTKQAKHLRNFERGNSELEVVVPFLCLFFFFRTGRGVAGQFFFQ